MKTRKRLRNEHAQRNSQQVVTAHTRPVQTQARQNPRMERGAGRGVLTLAKNPLVVVSWLERERSQVVFYLFV